MSYVVLLEGKKTYIAAIAAFLIALGASLNGYLSTGEIEFSAVISAFLALALLFLRQSIKKAA